MSAALYIVLEDEDPGFDTLANGKSLSREEEALNKIAWELKVTPLMEFFSMDTEEAMELMEFEGDPSTAEIAETEWFEPEEGLKTVQALHKYISENPSGVSDPGSVTADLAEFEQILTQARERGLNWHLAVDY